MQSSKEVQRKDSWFTLFFPPFFSSFFPFDIYLVAFLSIFYLGSAIKLIVYIKKKLRQVYVVHEVNLRFLSSFFFYNKLRPIFCSVRNTCTRKAHEVKIVWEDDFSVIDPALYAKKTPRTPDRRRTYGILLTIPDALPLSYRIFFEARDTKLGLSDKHPAILLQGQSEKIF